MGTWGRKKTDSEEKRLSVVALKCLNGPIGDLVVWHLLGIVGVGAPVPQRVPVGLADFLFWSRSVSAEVVAVLTDAAKDLFLA